MHQLFPLSPIPSLIKKWKGQETDKKGKKNRQHFLKSNKQLSTKTKNNNNDKKKEKKRKRGTV